MKEAPGREPCCARDDRAPPPGAERRRLACDVFRALSDPTRVEIFALIAARPEPLCVCDIVARFDVSQPTISHHLKVLREARLVTAERRGTWSYYAVDARGLEAARGAVDAVLPEAVPNVREGAARGRRAACPARSPS